MKKYFAELVGTFFLVFFGVGTAVVAGDKVGIVGIAFAFGLGLVAAAYGIGPISGCHINPAVSLGVFVAGRLKIADLIGYWVGQFAGAILAAWVVSLIAAGVSSGYSIAASGLGQNGWGPATRAATISLPPSPMSLWPRCSSLSSFSAPRRRAHRAASQDW